MTLLRPYAHDYPLMAQTVGSSCSAMRSHGQDDCPLESCALRPHKRERTDPSGRSIACDCVTDRAIARSQAGKASHDVISSSSATNRGRAIARPHAREAIARISPGPMRGKAIRLFGLLLALVFLAVAGSARADSLVFSKPDGNIYLANPDGSGQYQVTLDGTPSDPYSSPSETASGVIEAAHGTGPTGQIVQLAQNGTPLISPFTTSAPSGPFNPVISPDDKYVAYWSSVAYDACWPWLCPDLKGVQLLSDANQYVDPSTLIHEGTSFSHGVWLSDTRLLLFNHTGSLALYDIGSPEPVWWGGLLGFQGSWFLNTLPFFFEGAASADGTRLAIVTGVGNIQNAAYGTADIQLFSTGGDLSSAAQPAEPTPTCSIAANGSDGYQGDPNTQQYLFSSVTWSPDGQSLAFAYNGAIYVAHIPDGNDCSTITVTQVIASGGSPYWSAASINPAPRQGSQSTTGTTTQQTTKPPPPPPVVVSRVGFPLTGKLLRISRQNALVALKCIAGRVACDGQITVQSGRENYAKGKVTTYATGFYSLSVGDTHTFRLRLSRSGRALARRHRMMTVWINVSIAGSSVVLSEQVKVRF